MYLVIGAHGCGRCKMVVNLLTQRKLDFEYKMLADFPGQEQDTMLQMAQEAGESSLPIVFKDGVVVSAQQVLKGAV